MFFYVLLAHAALSYPPLGMLIAGAGNIAGYLTVGLVVGGATWQYLLAGVATLVVATGTCAYASYNHAQVYRRTAAFARQLAVLAERDGLSGCLNHRTFHERLQAEAVIADATHPLSLLIVDVDSFKTVNDTHGHPAGDAVLRLVGQALLDLSRAEDTPGRLGGDEFALLLPHTPLPQAAAAAERLRHQVRERAGDYGVTVSVGIATTTTRSDTAGLLAAADRAVYRAKRAGRDCTAGHDDNADRQDPQLVPPRAVTAPA
jgi:diguanylate cyclase (GGDEF)-like protein